MLKKDLQTRRTAAVDPHSLPEQTPEQQLKKAQIAVGSGDNDEAVRLYRLVLHADPANLPAGSGLISLLLGENKKSEAIQVADDALKAKPDDAKWKGVKEHFAANTPEQQRKVQEELINQNPDPILRAMKLAELALAFGDMDGAAKHFADAEKAGPKDPRVLVAKITFLLRQKKVDEAARALDAAANANADGMDGLSLRTQFAMGRQDYGAALKYANQLVGQYGDFAVNSVSLRSRWQAAGQLREAVGSTADARIQRYSRT